ncbi:MAG: DUF7455 domain-containing protein [Amnibacterium sp.]
MTRSGDHGPLDSLESQFSLTALDRCDSCGAQAYIRVQLDSGELLFCAHHGKKYQEKLSGIAQSWHDESSKLLEETKA